MKLINEEGGRLQRSNAIPSTSILMRSWREVHKMDVAGVCLSSL
jgi:hypothetical protein